MGGVRREEGTRLFKYFLSQIYELIFTSISSVVSFIEH